jgi:hypothetical protein
MQAVDGVISSAEYNLFASKAQEITSVDNVAAQVDAFRSLSDEARAEVLQQCNQYRIGGFRRSSLLNTIRLNRSYAYKMWTLSNLIEEGFDQSLRLRQGSLRGETRSYLEEYAVRGTYIEFTTEKEFLAWMGDPNAKPTKETALDVYIKRGDLFAASIAKKELGASSAELRSFKRMMINEKTLEDNLEHNIDVLGRKLGLTLELVGRQYATTVGPIDLLTRDRKSDQYFVVELKRDRSTDRVFGQLSRYMGWVKKNLADGSAVGGVIVAAKIDDKLRAARDAHDTTVHLVEFESRMSIAVV